MIVPRLLILFPEQIPQVLWVWWLLAAGVGAFFYVLGARFSSWVTTLGLVFVGAMLGKHMPGLLGWKVDPMATTIGGAVVLGLVGYGLHRWVMGLGLVVMTAVWTGLGVFVQAGSVKHWDWFGGAYQGQLGSEVAQRMAAFCGLAVLGALAVAVMFPRLTVALFWTMVGMTLVLGVGLGWGVYYEPGWLERVPSGTWAQVGWLGALLGVGLMVQWGTWRKREVKTRPEGAKAAPQQGAPAAA